jgi:hypothetical protein
MSAITAPFKAFLDRYKEFYTTHCLWGSPTSDHSEGGGDMVSEDHLRYMNALEQRIFGDVNPDRSEDIVDTILLAMREMARGGIDEGLTEAEMEIRVYAKFHQHFESLDEPPETERTIEILEAAKTRDDDDEYVPPAHVREYMHQTINCYDDAFDSIPHETRAIQHTAGPWYNTEGGRTPLTSEPGNETSV